MENVVHSTKRSASMNRDGMYRSQTASSLPGREDYAEIFSGFHFSSSRVSSIPVLDLPFSCPDLDGSTPSATLLYDDVFESNHDIAITYDELIQILAGSSNHWPEAEEDDSCNWTSSESAEPCVLHLDDEFLPFKVTNGNLNAEYTQSIFVNQPDVGLQTAPCRKSSPPKKYGSTLFHADVDMKLLDSMKGEATEPLPISCLEIAEDTRSHEMGVPDHGEELQELLICNEETDANEKDDIVYEMEGNNVRQTNHTSDELATEAPQQLTDPYGGTLSKSRNVEEVSQKEEANREREFEEERLRKMEEERDRETEREKDRATIFETKEFVEPHRAAKPGELESPQRLKARLDRQRRIAERAAQALAEKSKRDMLAQREKSERNRFAESWDAEVKRWSSGKEGNLRALVSTLQYILGSDSGWQAVPLTDVITAAAVKKAYRKATLWVHPDKLQQRGVTVQQRYVCEKVFDLLKEAWTKFNTDEL